MKYKEGLPVVSDNVLVAGLHPRAKARLRCFANDPILRGNIAFVSCYRPTATQKYLYEGWMRRKKGIPGNEHFNLAADYERPWGGVPGDFIGEGSRHQGQEKVLGEDWSFAADVRIVGGVSWSQVWEVAEHHGLAFPLKDYAPYPEKWHAVAVDGNRVDSWVPVLDEETIKADKEATKEANKILNKNQFKLDLPTIKPGQSDPIVSKIGERLAQLGWIVGSVVSETYTKELVKAVKKFQKATQGLSVDGVIGPLTYAALYSKNAAKPPK